MKKNTERRQTKKRAVGQKQAHAHSAKRSGSIDELADRLADRGKSTENDGLSSPNKKSCKDANQAAFRIVR